VAAVVNDQTASVWSPLRQHLRVLTAPAQLQAAALEGTADPKKAAGEVREGLFSCISLFPGGLVAPHRLTYKGEEVFNGQIGYGMFNEFDYEKVKGKDVAIIGSGAFGVENIRTCLESGAAKTWIICRKKNLAMPRVMSWFVNQCIQPLSAVMLLEAMKPMYDLIPEDPWSYYAVIASKDRTNCTIRQKSRFGITDVFFLAHYFGRAEEVVDEVKRLKDGTVMLERGGCLFVSQLIKCLGFVGDHSVDQIMGIREMLGPFVNRDWRRCIFAESPGLDAGRFAGTSFSPKGAQDAEYVSWFINYPKDLEPVFAMESLPLKKVDKKSGRPTYVWDVRSNLSISMAISGLIPGLAELGARHPILNRQRMLDMHPLETFIDECAEEWQGYCKLFQDENSPKDPPPYPYTHDFVRELVARNDAEIPSM